MTYAAAVPAAAYDPGVQLLLVEDDAGVAAALVETLEGAGWGVTHCRRGDDGLHQVAGADLVVLDLGLPDMDGLDFLRTIPAWAVDNFLKDPRDLFDPSRP